MKQSASQPTYRLEPVRLTDRGKLSEIVIHANLDDPFGQIVWPNVDAKIRIAAMEARLPSTILAPNTVLVKAINESTGEFVAYSQWTLPESVFKHVNEKGLNGHTFDEDHNLSPEAKDQFDREYATTVDENDYPIGMRVEVPLSIQHLNAEAKHEAFPKSTSYIMLDQVKTSPEHQRQGAASALMKWGCEVADEAGLPICLEATPVGLGLYEKFGAVTKAKATHDFTKWGGPDSYTWSMMVRAPRPKFQTIGTRTHTSAWSKTILDQC